MVYIIIILIFMPILLFSQKRDLHFISASPEINIESSVILFNKLNIYYTCRLGITVDNETLDDNVVRAYFKFGNRLLKFDDKTIWFYYPWLNLRLDTMRYNTPFTIEGRFIKIKNVDINTVLDMSLTQFRPGLSIIINLSKIKYW